MRYTYYWIFAPILSLMIILVACEDYVTDVDPLINRVENENLTSESQVPFLINGVKARFATTHDHLMSLSGLLSDELFFDSNVPNATFPTFAEVDMGVITPDNNSVDSPFGYLGELRFFADDLVERAKAIAFQDESLQQEALYTGYLYGGIARYLYATYFGLADQRGGVIDGGDFIPAAEMYQLAIGKLDSAKQYVENASQTRILYSLIARTHLFQGNYPDARSAAEQGMIAGDVPFQSLHSLQADNFFWQQYGNGRTQAVADYRFHGYITADLAEASRVPLDSLLGMDGTRYYYQGKYPSQDSPIPFITWQENELMLAELDLRDSDEPTAIGRINTVRASHGIPGLGAADMQTLIAERDKELCFTGVRLADQRRFDLWHLSEGTWQYFPIPERERNANENIE